MCDRLAAELRCALDPVAFARERLGFEPDPWQADVLGLSGNTLLNCSRQTGKSTCTAIIGLHTAVYMPESLVLLGSPSLRQSRELFVKVTAFLRKLEPAPPLEEDNRLSLALGNGSRVVCLPPSAVGSPCTALHALRAFNFLWCLSGDVTLFWSISRK